MNNSLEEVIRANRLCLDFVNLPFVSGDPTARPISWSMLVDFLVKKDVISASRGIELQTLTESDPQSVANLLQAAEQLGQGTRFAMRALTRNSRIHREWVEPINSVLQVTEGYDQLEWDGTAWRLDFYAKDEGMQWLLAAIARSAAELVTLGTPTGVRQCGNPACELLFYDESRTQRRRWCSMALCGNRSKVAAFAKRHSGGRARAQHA